MSSHAENNGFQVYESRNCGSKLSYVLRPLRGQVFRFRVKAPHDVNICITTAATENPDSMYEVFLGGLGGTKSGIRKDKKQDLCEVDTTCILSDSEYRGFWVAVLRNTIKVGYEGEVSPFLSYTDPTKSLTPTHYGYCTAGVNGLWTFTDEPPTYTGPELSVGDLVERSATDVVTSSVQPLTWVPCSGGSKCHAPVSAGPGANPSLVAAAYHEGGFIPGILRPNSNVCHVPWGGYVHEKENYYLLSNAVGVELQWLFARDGKVPPGAVLAANTEDGEDLYIGRVLKENVYTSGKIHPSHKVCYIADEDSVYERHYSTYRVLCLRGIRVPRPTSR